ncbi:sulfotransferase [Halopseudomonas pachastrellae]|uniref:sulfotransferase n=1 Tax=Halopseudomonas pachastrellae TaxID=254161 RepID=UPI003D7E3CF0
MNDTSKTGLLEKREKNLAPIIIVGMHRSGTTMLVDIFEKLGGFFGNKYGINKEAYEFLKFHEETLRNTGGAWDNVELLKYIDEHKIAAEQLQKKFLAYSQKRKIKNYISKGGAQKFWGWKDPRNCLFISNWANIFPEAKVIFIYRNPLDVAKSLKKRSDLSLSTESWLGGVKLKTKIKDIFRDNRSHPLESVACTSLRHGLDLWTEYNKRALRSLEKIEHIKIKYENLLADPEKELKKIFDYLDIQAKDEELKLAIKEIDTSNSYTAKTQDFQIEDLKELKHNELIDRLGYNGKII